MPDNVMRRVSERLSHARAVRAKIVYFWRFEINDASVCGGLIECLQSQSITEQLPE
jgi:hypothetical protein